MRKRSGTSDAGGAWPPSDQRRSSEEEGSRPTRCRRDVQQPVREILELGTLWLRPSVPDAVVTVLAWERNRSPNPHSRARARARMDALLVVTSSHGGAQTRSPNPPDRARAALGWTRCLSWTARMGSVRSPNPLPRARARARDARCLSTSFCMGERDRPQTPTHAHALALGWTRCLSPLTSWRCWGPASAARLRPRAFSADVTTAFFVPEVRRRLAPRQARFDLATARDAHTGAVCAVHRADSPLLDPDALLTRLCACRLRRFHTLRYYGVVSSHSVRRREVVPQRRRRRRAMADHDLAATVVLPRAPSAARAALAPVSVERRGSAARLPSGQGFRRGQPAERHVGPHFLSVALRTQPFCVDATV